MAINPNDIAAWLWQRGVPGIPQPRGSFGSLVAPQQGSSELNQQNTALGGSSPGGGGGGGGVGGGGMPFGIGSPAPAPPASKTNWAPDWVNQWVQQFAPSGAYDTSSGSGRAGGGGGTSVSVSDAGKGAGQLAAYYNPENWGPPPPLKSEYEPPGGWFPEFNNLGSNPNEKFWTMKSFNQQLPGDAGMDERPNTRNPQYAGLGNFMYLGHPISQSKLYYDTHRPTTDPMTAGSLLPYRGWGREAAGWSTTGEVGFPGQLEPFGVAWGGGGGG